MAAYQVRQGDIFGRVGSGLGSGLAEQLPQEMDRYRLSKGLQEIDNNPNLTPAQRYGKLLTLPGLTPQGLQGYSELMQRKMMGDAMNPPNQPSPFPEKSVKEEATNSEIPSLTKEDSFAKAQEGFIPRTEEQKLDAAGTRFKSNPALFKNDPQRAIDYENQIDATNEKIAAANQTKHQNLTHIQDNVVKRLGKYSEDLGVDIPTNVYSKIEDKAIQATKPRSEGGGGLTEQQAMKEYGKELDAVSRDYSAIDALGGWGVVNRPAKNTLSSIQALQDKFEKRGDTENFADTLISKGKFSPLQAYSMAQPVKKVPALNNELFKLKDVFSTRTEDPVFETKSIAPKLAKNLGQKGSPLAVAYELKRKGYDANTWLDYLQENREELNLQDWQGRQLDKPRNLLPEFNDWWLNAWSGIDKLKEEK